MRATVLAFTMVPLILILIASDVAGHPGAEDAPGIAAARVRQESVKTVDIKLKLTEVYARGGVSEAEPPGPYKPKVAVPDKETTLESVNRLVLAGTKIRFEENRPSFRLPDGELIHRSRLSVSNGSRAKGFYPKSFFGNRDHGTGVILKDARQDDVRSYILTPLTMTFRGLDPAISPYPVNMMKPTGLTLPIEGVKYEEYSYKLSDKWTITCWLNPDQDYVIRRIRLLANNSLSEQFDIQYHRDENVGWVPDSWVRNKYAPNGAVLVTSKVNILEMRFNAPQPDELFDIQFPTGSEVIDHRDGKLYKVQPDGTMRELSRDELIPGGAMIPRSDELPKYPWYRRNIPLLTGLGVVFIILTYVLIRRRTRLTR
ncbi:MAG TPA: hypothetical protein VNK04_08600 [Gemmataceae bacterium]|nr:hypothetical protein [Gemmataceae bacterium]